VHFACSDASGRPALTSGRQPGTLRALIDKVVRILRGVEDGPACDGVPVEWKEMISRRGRVAGGAFAME
jgi:hypothetical protein